jgi:hypothetical protein
LRWGFLHLWPDRALSGRKVIKSSSFYKSLIAVL